LTDFWDKSIRQCQELMMRRTFTWFGLAALVLALWTGIAAAATFAARPGAAVAIFAPSRSAIAAVVAAGGRILDAGPYMVVARFEQPGFVGKLYAAGALLVLDAENSGGCRGGAKYARTSMAPSS
jgi:hypothetical protein